MNQFLTILPLHAPLLLLPAARITFSIPAQLGEALLDLIETDNVLPVLACVPVTQDNVLTEVGTAARVLRLVKPPMRGSRQPYLLSLHGLSRVSLSKPLPSIHAEVSQHSLIQHRVIYPRTDKVPSREDVDKFKTVAMRMLDRLSKDTAQVARREGFVKIASMMDDVSDARALWMADVLVGSTNAEYSDMLSKCLTSDPTLPLLNFALLKAFLAVPDENRLQHATTLLTALATKAEVASKIAASVDESLSKQQKEFYLRQQLAAIQRELHTLSSTSSATTESNSASSELDDDDAHDADDLADLRRKLEAMRPGSEERRMGVREWRRLKRIPQGSVENGVIRSYLEWLTAVPWPTTQSQVSSKSTLTPKAFLNSARVQLDADHFGLEKIKSRLIEYLAVVRLREMVALKDAREGAVKAIQAPTEENHNEKALVPYDSKQTYPTPTPAPKTAAPVKAPILLFVGPPGTGKTSLGQSVAKALNRPFQRIALGGVRDEAEIRGHRRTYVASGPGLIVQSLRKAERADPVLLLDEIDKVGHSNMHGDPSAALLEVLDPEQNNTFSDHYINVPIDLSGVLFICTANSLDTVPPPLLDRCEVIQLAGYTYDEKMHIAKKFLIPKQLRMNGLEEGRVKVSDGALKVVATQYTREAGVRSLERAIAAVVRHKAVEWAEHLDAMEESPETAGANGSSSASPSTEIVSNLTSSALVRAGSLVYSPNIEECDLEGILGIARDSEEREREPRRGLVYGLVVMGQGEGGILPVETTAVPGTGTLRLTGSLGDVIKESASLAMTWVRAHAYDLCITSGRGMDVLKANGDVVDIHLHLPAGAQRKDGPSAGIAMVCALVSLLTGATVPVTVAMTGEITLRGRVTPVGGIKEKVLGAHRSGITTLILPWANRKDVEHDVAPEVKNVLTIKFVKTVEEGLEAAFGPGTLAWRGAPVLIESRL